MSVQLDPTPSQTVGPFFAFALPWRGGESLVREGALGERIRIEGRVLDGEGTPVIDALIEIWQANAAGRYAHEDDEREDVPLDPHFVGFGRCPTDDSGRYWFETIRPGSVPGPGGNMQAPHIAVCVLARGLLKRLNTRIYFSDAGENANDPIMQLVEPARRERLIARRDVGAVGENDTIAKYLFDIVLQGREESVFFAW